MGKKRKPEGRWLSEDYPRVVLYAHLSKEEATLILDHDIGDIKEDYGKITGVNHWWVKYQKVGEDDLWMCEDGCEAGDTVLCVVEKTTRPKGVVTRITVPIFDGWE